MVTRPCWDANAVALSYVPDSPTLAKTAAVERISPPGFVSVDAGQLPASEPSAKKRACNALGRDAVAT
jgi:hypothetical protein